ncbi:MAG TPA: hypothetical protein VEC16_04215 [Alphaproteobacteria bacterium]|nr:hypothetical protein [Alphaproteobacteria bacterium]
MSLENKLSARDIIGSIPRMSTRPEYFSGRGATLTDLNDEILETIYQKINKNYGKEVAQNYAQMVADLPVLSATDFLLSLYALESNEWKWDKRLTHKGGTYLGGRGGDSEMHASALATIGSTLGNNRDDTPYIRNNFLMRHKINIESSASERSYGFY